ncbi:MAG: sulfide/dihydroorotate dehydrogenase-like FAD/NAD-binding protein [Endomicrobium sp.]|jgi:ferredoxin--NADP+ reductase|nr:sulfide/dihydroorotate dehydrogenase-like FAD/NAD-binding protein [Endomicrobium sp.]
MYKIVSTKEIAPKIKSYEIYAPNVAKNARPGQFIMLRINNKGERIPLTITDINLNKGLIKIVFQELGKTTMQLGAMSKGEYIKDFLGPLGQPTEIKKYGTVVFVLGGVGVAGALLVIKKLKDIGNKIITIVGARCNDLLIFKDELRQESNYIFFTTNDGTYGEKGYVTDVLKKIINQEKIDMSYIIGPAQMMKSASEITIEKNIKTIVSLNPIMLDGTGMCGACRVTVRNKTKFACVDGPEFDAKLVNWNEFILRLKLFENFEKTAIDKFKHIKGNKCCKNESI